MKATPAGSLHCLYTFQKAISSPLRGATLPKRITQKHKQTNCRADTPICPYGKKRINTKKKKTYDRELGGPLFILAQLLRNAESSVEFEQGTNKHSHHPLVTHHRKHHYTGCNQSKAGYLLLHHQAAHNKTATLLTDDKLGNGKKNGRAKIEPRSLLPIE